jgi:hypothetical protein
MIYTSLGKSQAVNRKRLNRLLIVRWSAKIVVSSMMSEPVYRLDASKQQELERRVHLRTSRRVRNLMVELEPQRVILRGSADSYYIKQLAQQGVLDVLPDVCLHNAIAVDQPSW